MDCTGKEPLYSQIASILRHDIHSGNILPGEQLPSEHVLMKIHGVSRMTVRSAINALVVEGLVEKHHGKGSFCTGVHHKKKIDVLLNMSDHYFMSYYLRSISAVLGQNHAELIAGNTRDSNPEIIRQLEQIALRGSDGIILQGCPKADWDKTAFSAACEKLKEQNIPLIVIDYAYPLDAVCCASMDEVMIGSLAADHLWCKGHRQVAAIHLEDDGLSKKRLEGLSRSSLSLHLIPYCKQLQQCIRSATATGVTAFFCFNDTIAQECIDFLKEDNYAVPRDLSVISVDDTILAKVFSITSVAHAKEHIGEYAARQILSATPVSKVFNPVLVDRNSVKDLHAI